MKYHTKIQNCFTGRFLSEFAVKLLIRIPPHLAYVATLPCPVCSFFAHSVYVQLRTLEIQLCRILTDLIVLLCVHNERPIMSYWASLFFSNNNTISLFPNLHDMNAPTVLR